MKITINKKKYILISLFSGLLTLFLVLSLIIIPSSKVITSLSKQIFQERTELETLYLKGQSLKKAKEQYAKAKQDLPEIKSLFVENNNELALITTLENMAENHNLEQKIELGNQNIKQEKLFSSMPLTIYLQGAYIDSLSYLQDLEKLNLYVNFKTIQFSNSKSNNSLTRDPNKPTEKKVSTILRGEVYYQK